MPANAVFVMTWAEGMRAGGGSEARLSEEGREERDVDEDRDAEDVLGYAVI